MSYLTARPSRDLIVAGHQQITADWWGSRRTDFDLLISPLVLEEAGRGDPDAVARRQAILADLSVIELTEAAQALGLSIVAEHLLPSKALADALHIAIAPSTASSIS